VAVALPPPNTMLPELWQSWGPPLALLSLWLFVGPEEFFVTTSAEFARRFEDCTFAK